MRSEKKRNGMMGGQRIWKLKGCGAYVQKGQCHMQTNGKHILVPCIKTKNWKINPSLP
jgi:hypothetical protein